MKKLIAMLLALTLVCSLAACGVKEESAPETDAPAVEETPAIEDEPAVEETPEEELPAMDQPAAMPEEGGEELPTEELPEVVPMPEEKREELMGLLQQLVGGINDEMAIVEDEIFTDSFEWLVGVPYVEGAYAVISAPMMNAIAHEVILIELPEGADVEAFAADVEANLNPRKWVCVEAEKTWVKTSGQYVVKVMSSTEMADAVEANFNTVFGA